MTDVMEKIRDGTDMHLTNQIGPVELDERGDGEEDPQSLRDIQPPPEQPRLGRVWFVVLCLMMHVTCWTATETHLPGLKHPLARAVLSNLHPINANA